MARFSEEDSHPRCPSLPLGLQPRPRPLPTPARRRSVRASCDEATRPLGATWSADSRCPDRHGHRSCEPARHLGPNAIGFEFDPQRLEDVHLRPRRNLRAVELGRQRNSDCPDARAPGTMLLGLPKVPQFCPLIPMSANYLEIVNAPDSNPKQVEKVNGITVGIGFGAPSMITWTVPSLGIDIIGHGAITRRIVQTLQPR